MGRVWGVFKVVYLEIMQILTVVIISAIAYHGSGPEVKGTFTSFVVFVVVIILIVATANYWFREPEVHTATASRNSWTITGLKLFGTLVPLILTMASYVALDKNASDALKTRDLLSSVLASIIYYWLGFHRFMDTSDDYYNRVILKTLQRLCIEGIFALFFFIASDAFYVLEGYSVVRGGVRKYRYEVKIGTVIAWVAGLLYAFMQCEARLFLCTHSPERPRSEYYVAKELCRGFTTILYIFLILEMSSIMWRQSLPRSILDCEKIYENIGIMKLLISTVLTDVGGGEVENNGSQ
jgi:hypothetical protein